MKIVKLSLFPLLGVLFWSILVFGQNAIQLPRIEFLGEGPGTYTCPVGYNHLIIKKHTPFRFELNGCSYTSTKKSLPPERAWACTGNCSLPAVYHEFLPLGYHLAGTVFEMVIIDDDTDDRLNQLIAGDPANPTLVYTITQQGMVQTLVYTTTIDAEWNLYAWDSIGIVQPRINQPVPTPTNTPVPTDTPTPTPAPTIIPTPTPTATTTVIPSAETPESEPSRLFLPLIQR